MKAFWKELKIYERICFIAGIICTTLIAVLLLTSKGAIETVMPTVLCVGMIEFVAGGFFAWRNNKANAVRAFLGALITGIILVAFVMGWL